MRILYLLLFIVFTTFTLSAQTVTEQSTSMSLGKQNAFYLELDQTNMDVAEDVLKDFVKEYGKLKRNRKAKEYYSSEITISQINGNDPFNLYVKLDEKMDMVATYLWVDLNGRFADSVEDPQVAEGAMEFLKKYYIMVQKERLNRLMEEEEDNFKDLEKDLKKLIKENEKFHDKIEDAKEEIIKNEKNIEENLQFQEEQRMKIERQKQLLEEIKKEYNNIGKSK